MEIKQTDFNLKALLRETIDLFESQISEKNNKLKFILDSELPETLKGDPDKLAEILNNLIGNAVKFTQNGQIKVLVEKLAGGMEKETLEFAVHDTGKGIPEEKLAKLFEINDCTTLHYNGTGLGLPLCKQLIQLQGGTFKVESQLHKGTTCRFTLPFPAKKVTSEKTTVIARADKYASAFSEELTVNLHYLNELAGGSTGFIAEIITLFLQQTPQNIKNLLLYTQQKDWENVKRLAHKMKSAVALMGMDKLQKLLTKLETDISEQINLELIPPMIIEVTQICQKAIIELQVKQSELKQKALYC